MPDLNFQKIESRGFSVGKFQNSVQNDSIDGPFRRKFNQNQWDKAAGQLAQDEVDANLHKVGHMMHEKSATIRSHLKFTFDTSVNATTRLRAFIAIVNHTLIVLQQKTKDAFEEIRASKEQVFVSDLTSVKIPVAAGGEFTPDEILQSVVEALQMSVKVILATNPVLTGTPKFNRIDWDQVRSDFNLSTFYQQAEELWDESVWNDYTIEGSERGIIFRARNFFWIRSRAASQARHDNLALEFFGRADHHLSQLPYRELQTHILAPTVSAVRKVGRHQTISFSSNGEPDENARAFLAARMYAQEPYYLDLIYQSQQVLGGASLNDLLSSWRIIAQCARLLLLRLVDEGKAPSVQSENFENLVPVLQVLPLQKAIAGALNISMARSKAIVQFLTYRGQDGQELWTQPLVPVSDRSAAPIFPVTEHPNLLRIVDVWLRQLGVDMGKRGALFEAFARDEIGRKIGESELLKSAKVLSHALKFRPKKDAKEDIDIVIVIGSAVILLEAKCSLLPTDAKSFAMYRKVVLGAVEQIDRKAKFVAEHVESFREQLKKSGVDVSLEPKIIPAVLMSGPMHVGMPIDDIPIVDLNVLSVFFAGHLVEAARGPSMDPVAVKILYSSFDEAQLKVGEILKSPPQMTAFINGLRPREIRIHALDNQDWHGEYSVYDCIPSVEHIEAQVANERAI